MVNAEPAVMIDVNQIKVKPKKVLVNILEAPVWWEYGKTQITAHQTMWRIGLY